MDKVTYEWHRNYRDPLYNNIQRDGYRFMEEETRVLIEVRLDRAIEDIQTAFGPTNIYHPLRQLF
jgi:hypothetical protein